MSKKKKIEISELQKIKYDVYLKDRDYLISQKHKVEEREANLLILLSSAIFSLFFLFSRFVTFYSFLCLIITAQFFALISLFSILFSLIYSKKSFDKEITIRDIKFRNESFNEWLKVPENTNSKFLRFFLVSSRISIIIAILFWFLFYILNIDNMSNDKKTFTQNSEPSIKTNEPAPRPVPIVKED